MIRRRLYQLMEGLSAALKALLGVSRAVTTSE